MGVAGLPDQAHPGTLPAEVLDSGKGKRKTKLKLYIKSVPHCTPGGNFCAPTIQSLTTGAPNPAPGGTLPSPLTPPVERFP